MRPYYRICLKNCFSLDMTLGTFSHIYLYFYFIIFNAINAFKNILLHRAPFPKLALRSTWVTCCYTFSLAAAQTLWMRIYREGFWGFVHLVSAPKWFWCHTSSETLMWKIYYSLLNVLLFRIGSCLCFN